MKLVEVVPRLFMSARTHTAPPDQLSQLLAGIQTIVNVWHSPDPRAQALVAHYYLFPLSDGRRVDMARVDHAVMNVTNAYRGGDRVLVHCYGGRNRSGLVMVLALHALFGWSGVEGVQRVRTARPGALKNSYFTEHLFQIPARPRRQAVTLPSQG